MTEELPSVTAPQGWTLGHLLATGGTSIVHAVQAANGAPAILKWGRWNDRDIHARFAREADVLRALGPPATPTYIAHGSIDGWPYLVMEQVPGETLATWMARTAERGTPGEIIMILAGLAASLSMIHAAGYVHRDLKPENVVIGGRDTRLLDFGLAGPPTTQSGTVAGTVHYLAPEQLRIGTNIDHRADIYAFGVIAFEMLAGQPPFVGERRAIEYQHQVSRPPSLRETRPLPQELEELVMACLAKQPESRPQTADDVVEALHAAAAWIETLRGVGGGPRKKSLGVRDKVVLALIEGGDPVTVVRAITDVHGIVVHSRADGILAAFASLHHDAPFAVALGVARELAQTRCRVVLHVASALVRRSSQHKTAVYGEDVEQVSRWTPAIPFTGIVLTAAAGELAGAVAGPAADLPGFFRELDLDRTNETDVQRDPKLVGRDRVIHELVAGMMSRRMVVGISGLAGTGKSRVLAAIVDQLRASGRDVIAIRGRRRFFGDRPDDDRLVDALGERRAILVVDDAQWFSASVRRQLLGDDVEATRVIASPTPLLETSGGADRVAIDLPALTYDDAVTLLRDLFRPARLIPDVLLERLAIRAGCNPGVLVALARDIKRRGGVRRQPGSQEWYVAVDETDTLSVPPSPAWFAARAIEDVPVELAPVIRACAALGPKFSVTEVAAAIGPVDVAPHLAWLVREGMFSERHGWYEFVDAGTQEAICDHALDERALVHTRVLAYWLAHPSPNLIGWLARVAYHAAGAGEAITAATCWIRLAHEARRRGEAEQAVELDAHAFAQLMASAPPEIARALDS